MGIISWLFASETETQPDEMPEDPYKTVNGKKAFCHWIGIPCGNCDAKKHYSGCTDKISEFMPKFEVEIKKKGIKKVRQECKMVLG